MREREISPIDLIAEVLLKWRIVIVWALVGGILMGGFSYVRSYLTAQDQKAQAAVLKQQFESGVQDELEYLQSDLTDMQINNVNTVLCYEHFSRSEDAYLRESVKMQIDPLNEPQATLTFQVLADDVETAQRIEAVYEDMVPGGLGQWLSEKVQDGTSEAALSELINLERNWGKLPMGSGSSSTTVYNISGEESDTFRVTICHISEEQCLQLAEKVKEYFQEQQSLLVRKMGDHQIQLVAQNFTCVIDRVLLERQQRIQNNIVGWNTNAVKLKDAFSAEEKKYYNYLIENGYHEAFAERQQSGEENQGAILIPIIQPSIKVMYVFIGMVMFAFAYAFYIAIKYILCARVHVTDDISFIYEIPELGVIPVEKKNKKFFAFVDKWILKLRNRNKRQFTTKEAVGLAAVAVKMAAKKEGLTEICCIGCNLKENAVKTAETIKKVLQDAGISVKVLNNVLYDQEIMEQLLSAKGAFLLERAEETFYDEISSEIELLRRQEIRVLGIILVE